uniref:Uncharacterized protein n=1 Tax=Ascaris lumbricoides TaxID=6252 RepID=A0A9J2P3C1_ASCLU
MTSFDNDDLDTDFDDFDDVVAPDPDSSKPADPCDSFATDESIISEKEFRRALDRFYAQTQNTDICDAPIGERIEPQNDFEKILEEIGMQRRVDDDGKISTYIADRVTHNTFARNLDKYLNDTEDTLFRALLLTKNAQASVFEMLMKKAEYFAKDAQGDKASNDRLALACIAQIRYLDVVYDPKPLFNSIFDRELEEWRCTARDTIIQSLPEILPNISTQQDEVSESDKVAVEADFYHRCEILLFITSDAADNLRQMFLKTVGDNPYAFRVSILRALTVLRTDAEMSDRIRGELIRNVMAIEPGVLPELVTYCLSTIQKDDKSSFKNVLYGLRGNLKIEKLKFRRGDNSKKTLGDIVTEVFVAISKKTKFGGTRLWKQVCTVLHVDEGTEREGSERAESVDDILPKDAKEFELFDVLLSFALMDIENCDRLVYAAFKHQLLSIRHRIDEFEEIISTAIAFREFSTRFLDAILSFSQQLIWSSEAHLISAGGFLLEKLFVSVGTHRERILNQITAHLNDIDSETTAALSVLQNLVQKHADMLIPFIERLHGTFNLLSLLSTENIRRLFHVLVVLQMTSAKSVDSQHQDEFKLRIDAMLSSPCARENIWGVLGLLMRLHAYIALGGDVLDLFLSRHTEEELELTITQTLATLDRTTRTNSSVRAIFYSNLARLLDENPRMPRSQAMLEWSEILRQEFREVFFEKRNEEVSSNRLEDDRYTRVECKEWLRLGEIVSEQLTEGSITKGLRIGELLSLFELLRAFARQKRRWEGDDTQEAYVNHWTRFLFAFEANISMKGVDLEARENERRAINCDIFCYAIQWIRLLLNTFADCELPTAADNELVGDVMRKKFALMLECQKSLIYTIKKVGEYPLPHMESSGRKEVIIHGEGGQILKKTPPTKKSDDMGIEENDVATVHDVDVILSDEEQNVEQGDEAGDADKKNAKIAADIGNTKAAVKLEPSEMAEHPNMRKRKSDRKRKLIDVNRVLSYFSPFRLVTVIKLIQLLPKKRKQTTFLLENLQKILEVVLPKKEKKIAPWMTDSEIPLGDMPVDHGDSKLVWRLISSVLPVLFSILDGSVQYFRSLADTSTRELAKPQSSRDEACETEKSKRARFERRKYVMELIEKAMLSVDAVQDTGGEEEAEVSVLNYLIEVADVIPSLDCAVELLDVFSAMEVVPDCQRLQIVLARAALSFLRKEWSDEDGNPLKGADLNRAVATILYLYIRLRRESKRLLAIQWVIANKVAELVPDEERRRSRISYMEECIDSELGTEEEHAHFCCFTKGTFASVYKVLFHSLNETVKTLSMNAIERSTLKLDEFFLQWKQAASCFCLLTLMIRVKDLRNSSVLLCAAREGRIFLHNFSSKSSFLHLLSAEKRFAKYAAGANAVMKTVQIGNRSLQNISVYAKTSKCIALLKLLPELRAASEMFIRAVHSVMVGVDCDDAFQIGLLKSRNLDGEEMKGPEESLNDEEEATPSDVGDTNEDEEGGSPNDVSTVDEEMADSSHESRLSDAAKNFYSSCEFFLLL